jgi:hypothetical protein
MILESFLLCTIGSVADLIRIGIELLEGATASEIALRVFIKGIAVTYPIQIIKRAGAGMGR